MKDKLNSAMNIGEEMLISGAEIHRVEDSMNRILTALGASRVDTFIITSSMVVTVHMPDGAVYTETRRIMGSGTDFERIHKLNSLSRRICSGEITADKINDELAEIGRTKVYPLWLEFICYAIIAGAFTLFFGGDLMQSLASLVIGALVRLVLWISDSTVKNKIFAKFITSFAATALAYLSVKLSITSGVDEIIIGNIMTLIPGIGLTTALRDIFTGDSITGILRSLEAVISALAIAAGYFVFVAIGGVLV